MPLPGANCLGSPPLLGRQYSPGVPSARRPSFNQHTCESSTCRSIGTFCPEASTVAPGVEGAASTPASFLCSFEAMMASSVADFRLQPTASSAAKHHPKVRISRNQSPFDLVVSGCLVPRL